MKRFLKKFTAGAVVIFMLCSCSGGSEQDTPDGESKTASETEAETEISAEPEPLRVVCSIGTEGAYDIYDKDTLYSEGVYMVNLDTDTVVIGKNPDERLIPASLTKIMTALVCLENIPDLSVRTVCPESCFEEFSGPDPNFEGASGAALTIDQDNLTYLDCLYGLMLPSGCEAANIIAYNVCDGDIPAFVSKMNETAAKIGCRNTNFTNPHGLYEAENYSSARDMYLITRYAMDNYPEFMNISGAAEYEMPANTSNPDGYTITHTNKMSVPSSDYYYEGVKGVKTGSINEYFTFSAEKNEWEKEETRGVRGLVSTCEKNGYHYLLATIAAPFYKEDGTPPEKQYPYADHEALFDWVFEEFWYRKVISAGDRIMSVPVNGGTADTVELTAGGEYLAFLPNSLEDSEIMRIIYPVDIFSLEAPVRKGDEVGELVIEFNGRTDITLPLIAGSDVYAEEPDAA